MSDNIIKRLSREDYKELREILCPYCKYSIPDQLENGDFIHKLEDNVWFCKANIIRKLA